MSLLTASRLTGTPWISLTLSVSDRDTAATRESTASSVTPPQSPVPPNRPAFGPSDEETEFEKLGPVGRLLRDSIAGD